MEKTKMKITKQQLQKIIKEELVQEAGLHLSRWASERRFGSLDLLDINTTLEQYIDQLDTAEGYWHSMEDWREDPHMQAGLLKRLEQQKTHIIKIEEYIAVKFQQWLDLRKKKEALR